MYSKYIKKGILLLPSVVGGALGVYSVFYVLSLYSQKLFALPLFYAAYFGVFALPLSVSGLVLTLVIFKKKKDVFFRLGFIFAIVGILAVLVAAALGALSLKFNTFSSLQASLIYNNMMYYDIVYEMFEAIHGTFVF